MLPNFTLIHNVFCLSPRHSRKPRHSPSNCNRPDPRSHRAATLYPGWICCLECAPTPLHEQIEAFSRQHPDLSQIEIVPLFLLPGVHVVEDIPKQIAIAQSRIDAKLQVMPHLGSHPGMVQVLDARFADVASDARILMSHGSRRPGGNAAIEQMATALGAVSAYWSVEPKLATRLSQLPECQEIAILPYFLFSGGITDAIAQSVEDLAKQHSALTFRLVDSV